MGKTRATALASRVRQALAPALRAGGERVRRLARRAPAPASGAPEAPVLVVGRTRPYLDARWLVDDAEAHLAEDFAGRLLHPWDVACYDRYGRPLDVALRADGTVRLSVSDAPPDPVALRDRLTVVCDEARRAHGNVPEKDRCDLRELDLPDGDIPDLAVAMAKRFGHPNERRSSSNGDRGTQAAEASGVGPGLEPTHAGSRLHNFWHAIT